ncbi:MAG: hypothetical protein HOW73_33515 [Polyangiaceae bacterium]|nr:hypothetical protein [Polyangiaceae bacterium]
MPKRARLTRVVLAALGATPLFITLGSACGARDDLPDLPPVPPVPECVVDADCEGFDDLCRNVRCVPDDGSGGGDEGGGAVGGSAVGGSAGGDVIGGADGRAITLRRGQCREVNPVDCDDGDICTIDTCDPATGSCSSELAVHDNDGDGFNGPREGTKAGDPDSCGDDCDDTNENAFPGNTEVCDGADNDCNGIVDDNATFIPIELEPVRISPDGQTPAGPGGLAWSGESYVATYTGTSSGFDIWRSQLAPNGDKLQDDELLKISNSDGMGGPIVWTGDRYGVAWQERRDGDYEIYFRLLDASGATVVTSPVQLSDAFGFSVNPDLGWTGTRFVAVWQDERSGQFSIFGRTITLEGAPDSGEVQLVPEGGFPDEAPVVAASSQGIGVAWGHGDALAHFIQFQTFGFDLQATSDVVTLTDGTTDAVYPAVAYNDGTYVVAWFDRSASPQGIYAAVISDEGQLVVAPKLVSSTPAGRHSRYPSMRALGDRILLVFSDDRDGGQYELYGRMLTASLDPLTEPQRITQATGDSVYPKLAFGPDGNVGILFRDDRLGEQHVFFTRLGCLAGTTPPNP